jgi:hypothetical protein
VLTASLETHLFKRSLINYQFTFYFKKMEKIPAACFNLFPYISSNSQIFSSGSPPTSTSPSNNSTPGHKSFSIESILQGTTNNNNHNSSKRGLELSGGGGGGESLSGRSDTSSPISVTNSSPMTPHPATNGVKKRLLLGGGGTISINSDSSLIPVTGAGGGMSNMGSSANLGNYQHFPFIHHPAFHIHNQQAAAELLGK